MSALKQMKSSMVCTLGKLRKEHEDRDDGTKDPNAENDNQSAPYAAFLVDNCETAARSVILACSDAGWSAPASDELKRSIKLALL